jgi:hypothetical protein
MQDVVIVPTFDRPEMLWLCLEYLANSPDSKSVDIWVYVDSHTQQKPPRGEIEQVLEKFPDLSLHVGFQQPHDFHGNSYNLLTAYKAAYETTAQYVFMVEDDVLIHPGFFEWHRHQHAHRHLGCSIAVKNPGHGAYASLGVCFRREMLRLVLPHTHGVYFRDMRKYCREKFPPSRFDCEQDGLFARVLNGHQVVWASTPLAQHVGWYGYHRRRSRRPHGTLTERYRQVKYALAHSDVLKRWARDFGDIEAVKNPCN